MRPVCERRAALVRREALREHPPYAAAATGVAEGGGVGDEDGRRLILPVCISQEHEAYTFSLHLEEGCLVNSFSGGRTRCELWAKAASFRANMLCCRLLNQESTLFVSPLTFATQKILGAFRAKSFCVAIS